MSDDVKPRHGLGRGLSALLGDGPVEVSRSDRNRSWREVPIERLRPGRFQPRHRFDPAESEALVASIRERGILQPILVRRIAAAAPRNPTRSLPANAAGARLSKPSCMRSL